MELYIKQRVFTWTDTYDVYDAAGKAKYFVTADFLTLGHQIRVYDKRTDAEIGSIHQRLLRLLPAFDIVMDGRVCGTVQKRFSPFCPRYDVDFRGWSAEGDLFGWDYRVMQGERTVMTISKALFSWGDAYTLRYEDPAVEMPALLLVLAIDAANCGK